MLSGCCIRFKTVGPPQIPRYITTSLRVVVTHCPNLAYFWNSDVSLLKTAEQFTLWCLCNGDLNDSKRDEGSARDLNDSKKEEEGYSAWDVVARIDHGRHCAVVARCYSVKHSYWYRCGEISHPYIMYIVYLDNGDNRKQRYFQ